MLKNQVIQIKVYCSNESWWSCGLSSKSTVHLWNLCYSTDKQSGNCHERLDIAYVMVTSENQYALMTSYACLLEVDIIDLIRSPHNHDWWLPTNTHTTWQEVLRLCMVDRYFDNGGNLDHDQKWQRTTGFGVAVANQARAAINSSWIFCFVRETLTTNKLSANGEERPKHKKLFHCLADHQWCALSIVL